MLGEVDKYEFLWGKSADRKFYRKNAPGERHTDQFIELARIRPIHTVADFGCGTGRGALYIHTVTDAAVTAIDFASNALDRDVKEFLGEKFRFLQHDLTQPLNEKFDFGYCTDVMEHVPPEDVDKTITNICHAATKVFFVIALFPHDLGDMKLHLTVEDAYWWHDKLTSLGFRVDHSVSTERHAMFYGSMYANAEDITDRTKLNVEEERLKENIRANMGMHLREVVPHEIQDTVVYLLAGGPSLNDHEEEIIEAGKSGTPIVTVNGTYNWLLERGVRPAAQVMVDAREFNRRFVTPLVDTCKYLIGSQCDPEVLKSIPKEQVWLWHSGNGEILKSVLDEFPGRECYPVQGGTTIVTRALTLLAMLGFRKVEIFGWDSCLRDDVHHAYPQPENDGEKVVNLEVEGRRFRCHPWMVVQANDFQKVVKHILGRIDGFEMVVHGDGLIAHMLNTAAELAEEKEDGC